MKINYESPELKYRSLLSWGLLCNSVNDYDNALDDISVGSEEDDWLN